MSTTICSISLGTLHPVLVHLPLGMVMLALFFSLLPKTQRSVLGHALHLTLVLSLVFSVVTCITGYIHAQSGEFDATTVSRHQWTAIGSTIVLLCAIIFKKLQRPFVWLTAAAMVVTGHFGGTLTHGEGFLMGDEEISESGNQGKSEAVNLGNGDSGSPRNSESGNRDNSDSVDFYAAEIKPILESKCYSCHSSLKRKGGLRLDEKEFILRGGKHGKIITPGMPLGSPIYTSLNLPVEDEKHMPPKGKRQLTASEIDKIHMWVSMKDPFMLMGANTESQKPLRANEPHTQADKPSSAEYHNAKEINQKKPDAAISIDEAPFEAINKLKQHEVIITPSNIVANGLDINFVNVKQIDKEMISLLEQMSKQVIQIKLTGQTTAPNIISILGQCQNLRQLQLERTAITDDDMKKLASLPSLEYLNVYGTALTDQSLQYFPEKTRLKDLYVWGTKMSGKGIGDFKKAHPFVHVEAGEITLQKKDSTKPN